MFGTFWHALFCSIILDNKDNHATETKMNHKIPQACDFYLSRVQNRYLLIYHKLVAFEKICPQED